MQPHEVAAWWHAQPGVRTGVGRVLDHAADGPRRLEHAIGSVLGAALILVWLGWRLARP